MSISFDCDRRYHGTYLPHHDIRADSRFLFQHRGAHPTQWGTRFQVFAPYAQEVLLVLTAFGHVECEIPMERKDAGIWEIETPNASIGRTYYYLVRDCHGEWKKRVDPFSFALHEESCHFESIVVNRCAFDWSDAAWMENRAWRQPIPLSLYEMNVDTWREKSSWHELSDAVSGYVHYMNFTHVELYGILMHKNICSWGYQVDNYFAPNHRLGHADGFKHFVNACHQSGIGVIIDWIPGHYKHEHNGDLELSLHQFDGTNHFDAEYSEWGTVYFDFSKEETRRLLMASALYWIEEMHVDGLRVDALGPILKRNGQDHAEALHFFRELNALIHEKYPGVLLIAEETHGFPYVTEPIDKNGLGFDTKVGIHLQNQMRNYFKTLHEERNCDKLFSHLNDLKGSEKWIIGHSHDLAAGGEGRFSTFFSSSPTQDTWRTFADMRLFHAWNLFTPAHGHMIHMGDEIGQICPFNFHSEEAVEWRLLHSHFHRGIQECVRQMNWIYRQYSSFWKAGQHGFSWIAAHLENQVLAYHRCDFEGNQALVVHNFSTIGYPEYVLPLTSAHVQPAPDKRCRLEEIFNSDAALFAGTGNFCNGSPYTLNDCNGRQVQFQCALPPLATLVFDQIY